MAIPKQKNPTLQISLKQYVSNPTGKGSSNVASRRLIREGLNATFIELLQHADKRRQFMAIPYIMNDGRIIFHVKVPSSTIEEKFVYDVLIEFEADKAHNLENRNVRFFSNSPSFLFTYTYVYYHDGLIIPFLVDKYPEICLTEPPVIRNPAETLGYEKTTYIASRYLMEGGCLDEHYIKKFGIKEDYLTIRKIRSIVPSADMILNTYNLYKDKEILERNKKKEKVKQRVQARMAQMDNTTSEYKSYQAANKYSVFKKPKSKITAKKAKQALKYKAKI